MMNVLQKLTVVIGGGNDRIDRSNFVVRRGRIRFQSGLKVLDRDDTNRRKITDGLSQS
jgi:hypothetical protein